MRTQICMHVLPSFLTFSEKQITLHLCVYLHVCTTTHCITNHTSIHKYVCMHFPALSNALKNRSFERALSNDLKNRSEE